ncbi:cytochrome b/b6 domain-containing protein [Radicibacter daui]|uniref:cytochrome b/b6 domain-containing protein n=1 Tax=Radicibacter daui TaxID=3064829 RepID=UPI004046A694
MKAPADRLVRVWDLPLRLFHWLLVVAVAGAWITKETPLESMDWHMRFGLAAFFLIVFRLAWGVLGTRTARFASFVKTPHKAVSYLKKMLSPRARLQPSDGHSPLGGYAALVLIGTVGLQALSGIFSNDSIMSGGPLSGYVGYQASDALTAFHEFWFNLIIAAIVVHLAAILFYRLRLKTNLVTPMVVGTRHAGPGDLIPDTGRPSPVKLVIALLVAAVPTVVMWLVWSTP